ncbi:hypothetical protein B296_00056423 [Ensete ventricosum]|uniref:Uncharacterized protein n=1 Tax=Ensete ventricosum TaxID=4639 RepID=A0A426WYL9_ENSVE|nr:hypothetical protein B296_00056423 [Ensete ventricosum]
MPGDIVEESLRFSPSHLRLLPVLPCSTPTVFVPKACSGHYASNTEQRLPYWNIFTSSTAPKSNPNCYLCSDDDLELSGAVLKLPVFIPLSKGASIVRCHCHRFLLTDTGELHLQLPRIMTSL